MGGHEAWEPSGAERWDRELGGPAEASRSPGGSIGPAVPLRPRHSDEASDEALRLLFPEERQPKRIRGIYPSATSLTSLFPRQVQGFRAKVDSNERKLKY